MLSIGKELTADQRLPKALVSIMRSDRYVALASVLMLGDRVIDNGMTNTAATDGRDEWYNSDFVDTLIDAELRALIIHECKHKMYKHSKLLQPLWKMDSMTANAAADFVINLEIIDENPDGFCVMPEGCLLDEQYRGMDPTEVFWLLYDAKDGEDEDEGDEEGEGGEGRPCPWDDHDWKEGKFTNKEMREIDREIDRAIRQGSITASKLGGAGVSRDISGLLRPQVNWREVLRQFIQNQFKGSDYSTYARPNRRYICAGIYMPSGVSEHMGVLVNANDTSGSVGDPELRVIKTEVVELTQAIKPEELHVIYWDHAIQRHEIYQPEELDGLEHKTKPEGGGGTNPEIVPPYMKEKNINAQCAVVVTDGIIFGDWGDWDCPVLWVIIDNESAVPPHGEILHVKSSQLRSF